MKPVSPVLEMLLTQCQSVEQNLRQDVESTLYELKLARESLAQYHNAEAELLRTLEKHSPLKDIDLLGSIHRMDLLQEQIKRFAQSVIYQEEQLARKMYMLGEVRQDWNELARIISRHYTHHMESVDLPDPSENQRSEEITPYPVYQTSQISPFRYEPSGKLSKIG